MAWDTNWKSFDAAEKAFIKGNPKAVQIALQAGRDEAKARVPSPQHPGPFATGATRDSIYISTGDGHSDYADRKSEAQSRDPDAQFVGEAQPERNSDGVAKGVLGASTQHAPFIEAGHLTRSGSHVAPQPFLEPAAQIIEDVLKDEIAQTLRRAGFKG